MHEVQHRLTGENEFHEAFEGEQNIEELNQEKYLGQIISNDGSNVKNVINRSNKGMGMVNTITNILNYVPGGQYHFVIAVTFRNAYLISSMLSCSEVWYNLSEWDLRKLEQTDEALIRNIFDCSSQVTSEVLSLELGLLPARYIIMMRRIIYLHHIMKQRNKDSLIFNFLMVQIGQPKKNDWASQAIKDLAEIGYKIEDIETLSTEKFKDICKTKVTLKAF